MPIKPGVYTDYTLSQVTTTSSSMVVGIAACGGDVSGVKRITSLAQAKNFFAESEPIVAYIKAFFAHANSTIYAVSVSDGDYQGAFELLLAEDITLLCTDCTDTETLQALTKTLTPLAASGKAVVVTAGAATAAQAVQTAVAVNSERLCLTAPAVTDGGVVNVAPAILAGFVAASTLADNLNGALTATAYRTPTSYDDDTLTELMNAGVCVFQQSGSFSELLRGMTTKTYDENGNPDRRFQNISVVFVADSVVRTVQQLLKEKLLENSNGTVTLDSVLALLVCSLEDFVASELLTAYDTPVLWLDEDDLSVCHVSLSFTVRQGIYQVYLHAYVTV